MEDRRPNGTFLPRGGRRGAPAPMADIAIVTLILTRSTGEVEIEDTFSTPMETWAMLEWGREVISERLTAQ